MRGKGEESGGKGGGKWGIPTPLSTPPSEFKKSTSLSLFKEMEFFSRLADELKVCSTPTH